MTGIENVVIERIRELFRVRSVTVSEARIIGRDKVISAGTVDLQAAKQMPFMR
jgi:hypothetical protein